MDEDNIKIKLEEVGEKLEELKASVDNLEGRKVPVASKSKQLQKPEMPFDHLFFLPHGNGISGKLI